MIIYIACPKNPDIIIEDITSNNKKLLFEILNLAERIEINIIIEKDNISALPSRVSKKTFLISNGLM